MDTSEYFMDRFDSNVNWWSVAGVEAQSAIDNISADFDLFLKDINCKKTWGSEWYWGRQHDGIHAVIDDDRIYELMNAYEIVYFEPQMPDMGEVADYKDEWARHYPRMHALWEWLDRNQYHLQHAEYDWYEFGGYKHRKYNTFDKRWHAMRDEYEREVTQALEDVCKAYENELEAACEYAYSNEAAEEWLAEHEEVMA